MSKDCKFPTGAVRSADAAIYRADLMHPIAMLALARTLAEGEYKYGPGNWELGMPVADALNHALIHIWCRLAGDRGSNLAHAFCGLMFAIVSDEMQPALNADLDRGPGCTITPAMRKFQESIKEMRAERRKTHPQPDWDMSDLPDIARWRNQRAYTAFVQKTAALDGCVTAGDLVRNEVAPKAHVSPAMTPEQYLLIYKNLDSSQHGMALTKECRLMSSQRKKTGYLRCKALNTPGNIHPDAATFDTADEANTFRNTFIDTPEAWATMAESELRKERGA